MVWNERLKREIPIGWETTEIGDILAKIPGSIRLSTDEYLQYGKFPIIDQTTNVYFAGFTDREDAVVDTFPVVVFGDHSCAVKYVNFEFARGADGTQIMKSKNNRISTECLYFAVLDIRLGKGYARHYSMIKGYPIIVPSQTTAEQFKDIASMLFEKIIKNRFEILKLIKQRDELLPLLMNGQVSVNCDLSPD